MKNIKIGNKEELRKYVEDKISSSKLETVETSEVFREMPRESDTVIHPNEEFKAFDRERVQMRDMMNSRSNNTLSSKPNLKIEICAVKHPGQAKNIDDYSAQEQYNQLSNASQNGSSTNANNLKYSLNNVNTILNSNRSPYSQISNEPLSMRDKAIITMGGSSKNTMIGSKKFKFKEIATTNKENITILDELSSE